MSSPISHASGWVGAVMVAASLAIVLNAAEGDAPLAAMVWTVAAFGAGASSVPVTWSRALSSLGAAFYVVAFRLVTLLPRGSIGSASAVIVLVGLGTLLMRSTLDDPPG